MNNRVFKRWKKAIEKAYTLLQTDVEIHTRVERASVTFDDIFNEPVDPNATAYVTKIVRLTGMFTWVQGNKYERLAAGTVREEQGILHVRLAEVLKNPANVSAGTIFDDTEKVVVDGVDCKVVSTPRKVGINQPYNVTVILERSV